MNVFTKTYFGANPGMALSELPGTSAYASGLSKAIKGVRSAVLARAQASEGDRFVELDVELCLSVRSAFFAFVDYFSCFDDLSSRHAPEVESIFEETLTAFSDAKNAIDSQKHPWADRYLLSIDRKLGLAQRLIQGEDPATVFQDAEV